MENVAVMVAASPPVGRGASWHIRDLNNLKHFIK
jgi:hypothetical protein